MQLHRTVLALATFLCILPGCANPTASLQPGPPSALEVVGGDGQTGTAGSELPLQLVVRVTDDKGAGVEGVTLLWVGDGAAWADVTDTAEDGISRNYWTLGPDVGTQVLEVWTYDVEARERGILLKTFTATSTSL
jgi:hypothetical protein